MKAPNVFFSKQVSNVVKNSLLKTYTSLVDEYEGSA